MEEEEEELEHSEKKGIQEYVRRHIQHSGEGFREHFAMARILTNYSPRAIFQTLAMINDFAEFRQEVLLISEVAADEAVLLLSTDLLNVVVHFSKL